MPLNFSHQPMLIEHSLDDGDVVHQRKLPELETRETQRAATALEAPIPYRQKNLQLLCSHCNRLKGNRDQAYLMARLKEMAVI